MCHLFSGADRPGAVFRANNLAAAQFDKVTHDDILTHDGFLHAAELVCQITVCGLLLAGPACNTWVAASRGVMLRSNADPMGDQRRPDVLDANCIAERLAWLICLATCRGVRCIIEQPASSMLYMHPAMATTLHIVDAYRIYTHGGAFGCNSVKPYQLRATLRLRISRKILDRRHIRKRSTLWVRVQSLKWKGTREMSKSAKYTWRFSKALYYAWYLETALLGESLDVQDAVYDYFDILTAMFVFELSYVFNEPYTLLSTRFIRTTPRVSGIMQTIKYLGADPNIIQTIAGDFTSRHALPTNVIRACRACAFDRARSLQYA